MDCCWLILQLLCCVWIAQLSRLAVPHLARMYVFWYAESILEAMAEVASRLLVSLLGGNCVPPDCRLETNQRSLVGQSQITQSALGICVTLVSKRCQQRDAIGPFVQVNVTDLCGALNGAE
jgi:hypothetical protein